MTSQMSSIIGQLLNLLSVVRTLLNSFNVFAGEQNTCVICFASVCIELLGGFFKTIPILFAKIPGLKLSTPRVLWKLSNHSQLC